LNWERDTGRGDRLPPPRTGTGCSSHNLPPLGVQVTRERGERGALGLARNDAVDPVFGCGSLLPSVRTLALGSGFSFDFKTLDFETPACDA
jgi:hypothetical protein